MSPSATPAAFHRGVTPVPKLKFVRPLIVLVLSILIAVATGMAFPHPLVTDDPFITYRYALNLINGQGFVYNPGEHVLSTTAPLYSFILAAFGLVLSDIPSLGFWLSVLGLASCAWFIFLTARSFDFRIAGGLAALWILVSPGLVLTFGLETGFYLGLASAAAFFYFRSRTVLAFSILALLTLTRNDGVLLAAILGTDLLRAQFREAPRKLPRAVILPFSTYFLLLIPWLGFAWWWFGSPFPFTLTAKIAQAQSGLWDPFAVGLLKWLREWLTGLWPVAVLALIGLGWSLVHRSRLLLLALWACMHLAAYTILGVAFYAWYVAPLFPIVALFAGLGVEIAGNWLAEKTKKRSAFAAVVVLAGLGILGLELESDLNAGMQQPSPKVEVYRKTADWIKQNTPGNATVDALEVGVIGFYDQRTTFDFVGLVDPSRVPYLRSRALADGVRNRAADYVIMIPPDVWLTQDAWFNAEYSRVQEIRATGFYSGKPLVIFRRMDTERSLAESLPLNLSFENHVELLGVDLYATQVGRGGTLPMILHLRAPEALEKQFKLTVQLVGSQNLVAGQTDTNFPARLPEDGQTFGDHQAISVKANAPTGRYDLILAIYDEATGDRVNLTDANGGFLSDFVSIAEINVR